MGTSTSPEIGRIIRMDLVKQMMNTGWVGIEGFKIKYCKI